MEENDQKKSLLKNTCLGCHTKLLQVNSKTNEKHTQAIFLIENLKVKENKDNKCGRKYGAFLVLKQFHSTDNLQSNFLSFPKLLIHTAVSISIPG